MNICNTQGVIDALPTFKDGNLGGEIELLVLSLIIKTILVQPAHLRDVFNYCLLRYYKKSLVLTKLIYFMFVPESEYR